MTKKIRQQVFVRGKVKKQRRRHFLGLVVFVAFGTWGLYLSQDRGLRAKAREGLARAEDFLERLCVIRSIEWRGVPPALGPSLAAALGVRPGQALGFWEGLRLGARVRDQSPCLKSVRVGRNWLTGGLKVAVSLKSPVGRLVGVSETYLSPGGDVFRCPPLVLGIKEGDLVPVNLGPERDRELKALAGWLAQLAESRKDLPAPIQRVAYLSPGEGAVLLLADGTSVVWGDFSQTAEKLARLIQVWRDARMKFAGAFVADLKYFDEGKVLVRAGSGALRTAGGEAHGKI